MTELFERYVNELDEEGLPPPDIDLSRLLSILTDEAPAPLVVAPAPPVQLYLRRKPRKQVVNHPFWDEGSEKALIVLAIFIIGLLVGCFALWYFTEGEMWLREVWSVLKEIQ